MNNNRTKELIDLLDYINNELVSQYPCSHISSEHFLYAVLDNPDCIAYKAIERAVMHAELERLREEIDKELSMTPPVQTVKEVPYDAKLQKIFKQYANSKEIVSSGHILCAIIDENENIQHKFKQLRVTSQRLLVRVLECLNENGIRSIEPVKKNDKKKTNTVTSVLTMPITDNVSVRYRGDIGDAEKYMVNLNSLAKENRIPFAVGCDPLYDDIFRTLARCTKNNVILVGDGGVGKTAISKNIANFLVTNEVPKFLKDKVLLSFNLIKMFAGVMRGLLDTRTKTIMEDINSKKKYIVLIDDIDTIITIATNQDATEVISLFHNLLSSPNVYVIATCSTKGYNQLIVPNKQLGNLMRRVDIKKPSIDACCDMIKANSHRFEKFHDVKYTDETIRLCVELAAKHIKERSLPDSAFDILDDVGAGISMQAKDSPEIIEIDQQLDEIKNEQTKIATSTTPSDFTRLEELSEKERSLRAKKALLDKESMLLNEIKEVTVDDVYSAVSNRIGRKVEKLDNEEKSKLQELSDQLKEIVIGQDNAVEEVSRVVKRQRMKLFNTDKPAVLFFSGSTGTGKTYLAKQLAEKVFGSSDALVRLDMSEYADKISVNKLYGSPSGYVGYEEGGILTEAIKNKGRCVLLLDEIEKADDEVFNVFLQIFDDGRLTDNKGTTVSFHDTIIIMTSNIGASEATMRGAGIGFNKSVSETSKSIVDNAIKKRFKPEFLNRIDAIVHFNHLSDDDLRKIILLEVERLSRQIKKSKYIIGESFKSKELTDFILSQVDKEKNYGGRAIVRMVTKYIEDRIVDFVISNDIEDNHIFEIDEIIPEIKHETK